MTKSLNDQAIALAGVAQAAGMIHEVATRGHYPRDTLQTLVNSLFCFDADSAADVYGGTQNLREGFTLLHRILQGRPGQEMPVRYFLSMLHLQKHFAKNQQMMDTVRKRLQHSQRQMDHFTESSEAVCRAIDGIYQDTFSQLGFRVQVRGEERFLGNPDNAAIVRTGLLAGVRSAMLWRQSGGSRMTLLFKRKRLLKRIDELQIQAH
ncbi:MAG: lysogenization regulator HflD [Gammaproteobacteria bacterium]|nr:MAG: lysogenization regulator HflD [Gammaproteobacteria bacterium]